MAEIIDPTADANPQDPLAVSPGEGQRWFFRLACVALCVGALYLAQDVMIPAAVAVLVSFILNPLVRQLEGWRVPRVVAVLLTVALALAVCLGVLTLVLQQVMKLAEDLPRFEQTYKQRVAAIRAQAPGGLGRAIDMFHDLGNDVVGVRPGSAADGNKAASGEKSDGQVAIPVEVHPSQPTLRETLDLYVTPALMPLVRCGIVLILVVFLLLGIDDLRERWLQVAGRGKTRLTENAINEAGARVSGYLAMQFVNNLIYGLAVGLGLWAIGLPGAALWGLGAMLVRFIPYLGPWIGALAPMLLSLGVFSDWLHPLLVVLLFVTLEIIFNNVIEPYLFGIGAGLSPMAVIVSLIFWGWMWDGVGMLVAVPLTACLVVAGRYLPPLETFSILMSDKPSRHRRAVVVEVAEKDDMPPAARPVNHPAAT